jgi:hypothetical protein
MRKLTLGKSKYSIPIESKLVKSFDANGIKAAIERYMQEDVYFNRNVKRHLIDRLKVATGRLWDSINLEANVSVSKKSGVYNVTISVFLTDSTMIDALLDGKDLDNHGKHVIPTLSELEKYIRAKQDIFSKKIEQRKRAALRETKRNILSNIPKRPSTGRAKYLPIISGAIESIAVEIQESMEHRQSMGLPPTLGSKSMLLGYWEISHGDGEKFIKPRYNVSTEAPLYTFSSEDGLINQEINLMLDRFHERIFNPSVIDGVEKMKKDIGIDDMLQISFPTIIMEEDDVKVLNEIQARLDKLYRDAVNLKAKNISGWDKDHQGEAHKRLVAIGVERQKYEKLMQKLMTAEAGSRIREEVSIEVNKFRNHIKRFAVNLRRRRVRKSRGKR